ncbi:MAG: hypothetical protein ACPG9I_09050, partial [Crocinitomicaceae bacterium]
MNKTIAIGIFGIILFGCGTAVKEQANKKKDLEAILDRDTLIVLTENGALSYYEYKDKYLGFEYEILDSFARHIGVELQLINVANPADFVSKLNSGEGDVIACN